MTSRAELHDVLKLVWYEKLQPVVDRVLPLEQAKVVHELLERGEQFGKIVLRVYFFEKTIYYPHKLLCVTLLL